MEKTTEEKSTGYKIWHSFITRIIIGFLACGLGAGFAQMGVDKLLDNIDLSAVSKDLISGIITVVIILLIYNYLYKAYEKRKITELSRSHLGRNLGLGILIGAGLMSLMILVIAVFGHYTIVKIHPFTNIYAPLIMGITSGITEEILFRGILFRLIEEKLGSYIALILSALIFGFLHLSNPNASIFSSAAIAIEAGLLLGFAYMYSRNLWLPIALHFSWNFAQAIYGANVSGIAIKSLLTTDISGPELITGGNFGPEASIQAILFGLGASFLLWKACRKKNRIMTPFWKD